MKTTRWNRLKDVFADAAALDADERAAFLDNACGGDDAMRGEIETLLLATDTQDDFLVPPEIDRVHEAIGPTPAGFETDAETTLVGGTRIGHYELVELIATGGMGAVYLARRADDAFDKLVAIKIIRQGIASPGLRERFQRERQLLARLDHPNVTRLLDGGTTPDGLPYLVMEYVDGEPIHRYCDTHRLGVRDRLELFLTVCDAVQYAHRNLVVHRDLKPSNILVRGEGPDGQTGGDVKLLDFGISRLLAEQAATPEVAATVCRALTPEYASPEQIRGEAMTTATDVYSLGVVLYELLSGARPYRLADLPAYEAERAVCEESPLPPSTAVGRVGPEYAADPDIASEPETTSALRGETPARLRRTLSGDLDTIVLMALRKDPARRYASVEQFAEDIRRYLGAMPVLARKDTFGYRAAKLVQRNKPLVATVTAAVVVLIVALIGVSTAFVRARAAEQTALEERNSAESARAAANEVVEFFEKMLVSANPYRRGHNVTVLELLEDAERDIRVDFVGKPEVEAGVRLGMARTQASLMLWPDAGPNLERALALYRSLRRDERDDLVIAECLSLLGRALTHAKDPTAIDMQREGLAIRRRHLGDRHVLVAESTGNLGFALWATVEPPDASTPWSAAEDRYLDALDLYRRLGESRSRDAARFTMSLGYMYHRQGRHAEAERRYQQAIELYAELPVAEDLYEFATLQIYANLLEDASRFGEAAGLLETYRSMLPREYQQQKVRDLTFRVAGLRRQAGDREESLRLYREALALECEMLAAAAPATAQRARRYAATLRADDAAGVTAMTATFREVLGFVHETGAESPATIAVLLHEIAMIVHEVGDHELARRMLEDAVTIGDRVLPETHPAMRSARRWLRQRRVSPSEPEADGVPASDAPPV